MPHTLSIYLIAGEDSGDRLGAGVMRALRKHYPDGISFYGVGGTYMEKEGLSSLFPMQDVSVMGISAVLRRLPRLLRRLAQTKKHVLAVNPDILVIIDSPDFTHRIARFVRRHAPQIPIVNYAPPSVWAWRPARAHKMRPYIDSGLCLLPFEPEVYARLCGPPCYYVGHPLIEQIPPRQEPLSLPSAAKSPTVLLLPGSRTQEVATTLPVFRETLQILEKKRRDAGMTPCHFIVLSTQKFQAYLQKETRKWPVSVEVISAERDKQRAFRNAHAAVATSGTVTLELALFQVPMLVVYTLDFAMKLLSLIHKVFPLTPLKSFSLPNIILEKAIFPELLGKDVRPETIVLLLESLLCPSQRRAEQIQAFARINQMMRDFSTISSSMIPSERAAQLVFENIRISKI